MNWASDNNNKTDKPVSHGSEIRKLDNRVSAVELELKEHKAQTDRRFSETATKVAALAGAVQQSAELLQLILESKEKKTPG